MQRVSVVAAAAVVVVVVVVMLGGVETRHRSLRDLFPESAPDCANGLPCIPIRSCPTFFNLLQSASRPSPEDLRKLRQNHCGFGENQSPLTCCPDEGSGGGGGGGEPTVGNRPIVSPTNPITRPTTPSPAQPTTQRTTTQAPTQPSGGEDLLPNVCGVSNAGQTRIFFGEDSPLGAYPWIALLGYTSRFQSQVVWGCGGSLINSRYVITASHCTSDEFTFNRDLTMIRIGEHNLTSEIDCQVRGGRRTCAPLFQTFNPVEIIRHSDFNTRGTVSDDIALIRLDKEVEFNAFVGPICLPPPTTDLSSFLAGRQAFVAGWGATERGPDTQILQQVRIPFVGRDECNPHYNNGLLPEQVCFGGDGRRDSCFGDSGGPVVASSPGGGAFILLALVSFGQPSCGVVGVPAVYTSMVAYRGWILDNLKP